MILMLIYIRIAIYFSGLKRIICILNRDISFRLMPSFLSNFKITQFLISEYNVYHANMRILGNIILYMYMFCVCIGEGLPCRWVSCNFCLFHGHLSRDNASTREKHSHKSNLRLTKYDKHTVYSTCSCELNISIR